jgi:hypothetical protein
VNSKVTLVTGILLAGWTIYGPVAPGEAMSKGILILNYLILFGAITGAVGSVMQMKGRYCATSAGGPTPLR